MQYTQQQERAMKDQDEKFGLLMQMVKSGRKKIGIFGPAGTGKTHMAAKLIKEISAHFQSHRNYQPTVLCSALSHQACGVMEGMVSQLQEETDINYEVKTLASSLHHKKQVDGEGTVRYVYKEKKVFSAGRWRVLPPPIANCDILISDECSQLADTQITAIDHFISPEAYQLYLGDICQLPPIEKHPDAQVSSIFGIDNITLDIPFRYEGDLQVLGEANREQILLALDGKKFDINFWKEFVDHTDKDYCFFNNKADFLQQLVAHNANNSNPYHVKFISYHNRVHEKTSKYIRGKINPKLFDFEPGDLIMATESYMQGLKPVLVNSEHAFIERKAKINAKVVFVEYFGDYCYHSVESTMGDSELIDYYGTTYNRDIKIQEMPYFAIKVEGKSEWIPLHPVDKRQVQTWGEQILLGKFYDREEFEGNKWFAFYDLKNFFAEITYGYGSSSHKAQGITVDVAGTHLYDIMSSKYTTPLEKMQSLYVALTRAKYKNYIYHE